jgi:hypothetical protein
MDLVSILIFTGNRSFQLDASVLEEAAGRQWSKVRTVQWLYAAHRLLSIVSSSLGK